MPVNIDRISNEEIEGVIVNANLGILSGTIAEKFGRQVITIAAELRDQRERPMTAAEFARELVERIGVCESDVLARSRGDGYIARLAGAGVVSFGVIRMEIKSLAAKHGVKLEEGE